MLAFRHWLAHRLRLNLGTVHASWIDGRLFVYFQCATCGLVSGLEDVSDRVPPARVRLR